MVDLTLTAEPFLGGYDQDFDGTSLQEIVTLSLVAVSVPLGGEAVLDQAMQQAYGVPVPAVGRVHMAYDGLIGFCGIKADQFFAVSIEPEPLTVASLATALGNAGYYIEQSDNWVGLRLAGPKAQAALERVCMLDLEGEALAVGQVARTMMEHLNVIILREEEQAFMVLSASSSAQSFLHAIETSVQNVL